MNKQQYNSCKKWQDKVVCVSLYHLIQLFSNPRWTISNTAKYFDISIGLTSENLRLAREIDKGNKRVIKCETREEGLKLIKKHKYMKDRIPRTIIKDKL